MIHNAFRVGGTISHWFKVGQCAWEAKVYSLQMDCPIFWTLNPVWGRVGAEWEVTAKAIDGPICYSLRIRTLSAALEAVGRVSRGYDAPLEPEWLPEGVTFA